LSLAVFEIRPAQAADQDAIKSIVRAARISPFGLDWPRFLVAELTDGQAIIGVGQVKRHQDGSRELASIAVVPVYRRQGVASALIRALVEREEQTLFLTCRRELEGFYAKFGFELAPRSALPPFLARIYLMASLFAPLLSFFSAQHLQIIAMKRK
jgi:amino-acid N-acetyltransferase